MLRCVRSRFETLSSRTGRLIDKLARLAILRTHAINRGNGATLVWALSHMSVTADCDSYTKKSHAEMIWSQNCSSAAYVIPCSWIHNCRSKKALLARMATWNLLSGNQIFGCSHLVTGQSTFCLRELHSVTELSFVAKYPEIWIEWFSTLESGNQVRK